MFSLFFLSHGCDIPDKDKTLVSVLKSFSSSFTIVCSFFFVCFFVFLFFGSVFGLNNIPEKVS